MGFIYYLFLIFIVMLLTPLLSAICLISWLTSGLPIMFSQKRVGLSGRPFLLYKFRTMVVGAETLQSTYQYRNEANGPVFKIYDDPRLTIVGRFLSHTGLDELPQLFNVLKGDMVLIGPRPLPVHEAAKLKPWMRERHSIKPGIISPWVFEGYHSRPFVEWMKSDVVYARKKSWQTDARLALKALPYMFRLFVTEIIGARK